MIPISESAVGDLLLMLAAFLPEYPTAYSSRIDGLLLPDGR